MENLPPKNPNALGLFVSDNEWRAVVEFLKSRTGLKRAFVFGSRVSGIRRKPLTKPDIDLALEYNWPSDLGEQIRLDPTDDHWRRHCQKWGISVDKHGLGDSSDAYRSSGVLVWPLSTDE